MEGSVSLETLICYSWAGDRAKPERRSGSTGREDEKTGHHERG
jgi:hypothetical protein